jgi:shikimate kinase
MKITREEFDSLFQKNRLSISLVGMSNIGKTYWSERFKEIGFLHFNCDDLIEQALLPEMSALGYSGLADVSGWMGQPYNNRYAENQNKYLDIERSVVEGILDGVIEGKHKNTVIDTTGSVVHIGKETLMRLKKHSLIVFIEASKEMTDALFERYIKEPKPVVFGEFFKRRGSESDFAALSRSYRNLLEARRALAKRYADVVIPAVSIKKNMTIDQFISLIQNSL